MDKHKDNLIKTKNQILKNKVYIKIDWELNNNLNKLYNRREYELYLNYRRQLLDIDIKLIDLKGPLFSDYEDDEL